MKKQIKIGFWGLLVIFITTGSVFGQFSVQKDVLQLDEKTIELVSTHPGMPDTLISNLDFDIEVFIKDEKGRQGASPRTVPSVPNNRHISKMESGKGIALDSRRLRTNKPVTLILKVPSKDLGDEVYQLRGIQTQFDEHLKPTHTRIFILDENAGIEVHYHFEKGIKELPADHENHIIGTGQNKRHTTGHVCDPADPNCY